MAPQLIVTHILVLRSSKMLYMVKRSKLKCKHSVRVEIVWSSDVFGEFQRERAAMVKSPQIRCSVLGRDLVGLLKNSEKLVVYDQI